MKISLGWIQDFVEVGDLDAARVAELLALHTAEVEGVERIGAAIADVVVGHVVACGKHPDADKLSVTQVDFGAGETVPVVCGAPNVRQGLKVAFAPVGASLPGGLKIKQAKLRGALSVGMICSERELELSEEHAGILELPAEAPIGARLVDYLGLSDWVLELDNKSLTHRPDLWGHYGFARELAAILGRPLRPLGAPAAWSQVEPTWKITLADPDCSAYVGLGLSVPNGPRPSPAWVRARLLAVGARPRNDLVDLTNWVMLETGQPLHAFDATRLRGPIQVRAARAGDRLRLLDESERALEPADLVIADAQGPVALAGVMGGADSAVGDGTTSVFLESAAFQPARIRRTAQRLALRTDASSRFEKALDPAGTLTAAARYVELLARLRPEARVLGAPAVAGSPVARTARVRFDPARCARLLGVDPGAAATRGILERLGFSVAAGSDGTWQVEVPPWRATKDVAIEEDLVEEVGRIHGFHRIAPAPLQAPVVPPAAQARRRLARMLAERMRGAHRAAETQSYSFLERRFAAAQGLDPSCFVRLANPMQASADLVRRDPVASLLEQAAANERERSSGRLCEIARGYEPMPGAEPRERAWACLLEWERRPAPMQGPASLHGRLRSVAEDLLRLAGCPAEPAAGGEATAPWLHPTQALRWIAQGRTVVWSGRLHPNLTALAEGQRVLYGAVLLDLDALLGAGAAAPAARFQSPPRLPAVKVDVALALPAAVSYATVEAALRKAGGKLLESLELFDLYEGPNLPTGARSLAFHAVLRAADRTLEEKDEQGFIARVAQAAQEMGGTLRA